jgi:putative transposase
MPAKDAPIRDAINKAIDGRKRGRKKVIALVRRKHEYSKSRIRRVYEQSGLSLLYKPSKRLPAGERRPIERTLKANEEWAMDFMSDALTNGRCIRGLTVIDHYNLECKGIRIHHSIPSCRLIEILEQLFEVNGKPQRIRTDNGPEFISKRFQLWLKENEIEWVRIQPGKPQQNAIIERFNRTVREDLFDANLIFDLEHAAELAQNFIYEYNNDRPHESLNDLTPLEYAA